MSAIKLNHIYHSDCLPGLATLPDNSVDCCVTSPPYYALRDYGAVGQIGLEDTPEQFIQKLVEVFAQVRRVLKPKGTLWLNIGDSYWGGKGKSGQSYSAEYQNERYNAGRSFNGAHHQMGGKSQTRPNDRKHPDYKPKDLIGIPWMLAFALRADGWYLRCDIIWNKPNPMPESVIDRPTKAHEYVFLLTKSPQYYYDAQSIRTPAAESSISRWNQDIESQSGSDRANGGEKLNGRMKAVGGPKLDKQRGHSRRHAGFNERWDGMTGEEQRSMGANKRSVWTVATKPFSEAHFATFPPELIIDCIKAGCPFQGVVLDPFMGAGTTAMVARKLGRKYIGFELNEEYINIANRRMEKELGPLDALFQ